MNQESFKTQALMATSYKEFGLEIIKWHDAQFLKGIGSISLSFLELMKSKLGKNETLLDWDGEVVTQTRQVMLIELIFDVV